MDLEVNTGCNRSGPSARQSESVRLTEYSESLIFALPNRQAVAGSMDRGCHFYVTNGPKQIVKFSDCDTSILYTSAQVSRVDRVAR